MRLVEGEPSAQLQLRPLREGGEGGKSGFLRNDKVSATTGWVGGVPPRPERNLLKNDFMDNDCSAVPALVRCE